MLRMFSSKSFVTSLAALACALAVPAIGAAPVSANTRTDSSCGLGYGSSTYSGSGYTVTNNAGKAILIVCHLTLVPGSPVTVPTGEVVRFSSDGYTYSIRSYTAEFVYRA